MSTTASIFKVKVNGSEIQITQDQLDQLDIFKRSSNAYHLLLDAQSIHAQVTNRDEVGKKVHVEVEGESFDVEIKDPLDQMLDQMGFGKQLAKQLKEVKAPMPGVVLNIAVEEGQAVNEGDSILILGAMKMENNILIHADAVIKKINVNQGQAVDKGQVLVELE